MLLRLLNVVQLNVTAASHLRGCESYIFLHNHSNATIFNSRLIFSQSICEQCKKPKNICCIPGSFLLRNVEYFERRNIVDKFYFENTTTSI